MGKIGNYEYPGHTIEESAELVQTISDNEITKQDLLADKLGHSSPESGAFRNKLTSLKRYGLMAGRGGVNLSQLAEKIANPAPGTDERKEAMGQAWLNVDLFSKLYDRLDGDQPDDDFWYHIVEITDVERSEAKDKAGRIKRLYSNGLPYASAIKSADEEPVEKASRPEDEDSFEPQMTENVDASIKTRDFGEIKIRDQDTLDLARNLLDLLEKRYESDND